MADRFTASQLEQLRTGDVRATYKCELLNTALGTVDVSDRTSKYGRSKTRLFNDHPKSRQGYLHPVAQVVLLNFDGYLNVGNAAGPWPTFEDFDESRVRITITVCDPAVTVLVYEGFAKRPQASSIGADVKLDLLHPLSAAADTKWKREDRLELADSNTINRGFPS